MRQVAPPGKIGSQHHCGGPPLCRCNWRWPRDGGFAGAANRLVASERSSRRTVAYCTTLNWPEAAGAARRPQKNHLPHARAGDDRVARQRSGYARESQHGPSPGYRRHHLRIRQLARTARQGDAVALRRPSCWRRGRERGTDDRSANGARRRAAQAIPQRGGDSLRG